MAAVTAFSMPNTTLCPQQPWRRPAASSGQTLPQLRPAFGSAAARRPTGQRLGQLAGQSRQHRQRLEPCNLWPFDQAWGPAIDFNSIMDTLPQNLFAVSIIPYAGFLYHLHRSKQAPPLTLFGFYFLLFFVFATIPAGIYAKQAYGTSLANVDWLHGSAESMLTLTNLFIVLGLRNAIRKAEAENAAKAASADAPAVAASLGSGDGAASRQVAAPRD